MTFRPTTPAPRRRRASARRLALAAVSSASAVLAISAASAGAALARIPYLDQFSTVSSLTTTVPANGDVNPYGIVTVPRSTGRLTRRDLLVSNFNNSMNEQGTGTTIDEISPGGHLKLFAAINASRLPGACPGGVGLTTALVALRSGFVIVGSLPTSNGMSSTAKAGCLLVLNHNGRVVETISGRPINGPWDMTAVDNGSTATLFVTNVLNGTVKAGGGTVDRGTVVRIRLHIPKGSNPTVSSTKVIADGFAERTDPAALVVGPTGVAFAPGHGRHRGGTVYVADTVNSRIAAIPHALDRMSVFHGGGRTVSSGGSLNGPLGLSLASDGDLIAANANDGNLVEVTPGGAQTATKLVDPAGAGVLFGLVALPHGVYFVDDGDNTLRLFH